MTRRVPARLWLTCLVSTVLGLGTIAAPTAQGGTDSRGLAAGRVERDTRRFEVLNTQALWDVLAIRPGMTILDVGTGTGQFAYAFARRLEGRGTVYATDVNEGCVRYVREAAAKRSLGNVVPVLVRKDGFDEFYRSDTFDLIAIFHVLMDFEKQVDFLRQLGGSLAKDGRLVLLLYKEFPDFAVRDFTDDREGLVMEIMRERLDAPFYRAIKDSTRQLLRAAPGPGSGDRLMKAIVEDFNAILADANFGAAFFDGSAFRNDLDFTEEERAYAAWLVIPHNAQNVSRGLRTATWISAKNARMLNKLLIIQRFRKYLKADAMYAPGLAPAGREAFARAGYTLRGEYADIIPFEDAVVYTRDR